MGNEGFGFWETGHCSGEEYGRHFIEFADHLRAVDPNVSLLATGAPRTYPGFTEGLLRTAGQSMDYISAHAFHPPLPGMRPLRDDEADYWAVVAGPYALIRAVDDVLADIDRVLGPESPLRVSFDCYGTNYDLRAGLMFAGTFNRIHERVPRVEIAMIAQLVNLLALIQTDESGLFLTSAYLVNRLYVEETRPFALECELHCGSFGTPVWPDVPEQFRPLMGDDLSGVPFLDASATASADRNEMALFLVNRHIDDPLEVNLELEGLGASRQGEVRQLVADPPFAKNDFEHPNRMRIEGRAAPSITKLELPPHSVSVVIIH